MSDILKSCPFCQKPLTVRAGVNAYGRCDTPSCWMEARKIALPLDDPEQVRAWNRRALSASPAAGAAVDMAKGKIIEFATAILHGDDEHRGWLMGAALAFNAGDELPAPHGKGAASPASHGVVARAIKALNTAADIFDTADFGHDVRFETRAIAVALSAALAPALAEQGVESQAISDIAAERKRQIEAEGWTPEHDDLYRTGEMAFAAASYAVRDTRYWPWAMDWFKPTTNRRDLVKAGALIAAEIDRLDRAAAPEQEKSR